MKIIIFGKDGQLGQSIFNYIKDDFEVYAFNKNEADITNHEIIRRIIFSKKPNIIINCAAYTNVDGAEDNKDVAYSVNGYSLGNIGEAAKNINATVIHFSTDYVFDGKKSIPYTEKDTVNPINEYGKSKLLGEDLLLKTNQKSLIFRISWVHSRDGNNFLSKILELSRQEKELKIVNDQIGSPITSSLISCLLKNVILKTLIESKESFEDYGLYNLAPSGKVTWYGFTVFIQKMINDGILNFPSIRKTKLIPVASNDFVTKASRPKYSLLDASKFSRSFNVTLPSWQKGIIREYGNKDE